jgi:hypothetical protein
VYGDEGGKMAKGVQLDELIKALPREQRADFAEKLKREGGVELAYTVAVKHRTRKHRFAGIEGKPIQARFKGESLEKLLAAAAANKLSPGLYLKSLFLNGGTKLAMSDKVYTYWKNKADKWCVSVTAYIEAFLEHEATRNHHLTRNKKGSHAI